jgi:hypothetical protein
VSAPRLLAVLLNYRTAGMTLGAARAALAAMEGIPGELVIVDNDSGDGSEERLRAAAEAEDWLASGRVRVIQSGRNGGFGAGNNAGIRAGLAAEPRPDYVYILNSDAFPAPDAIRILIDHLEADPSAGFAGSHIHGPEGDPHVTAFRYPSVWSELEGSVRFGPLTRLLRNHVVSLGVPGTVREVDWLAGASLMMRRRVLDEIGLFDERFFLYFEETDLCRRARRAGWPTHYVPQSRVAHVGSVSTGMKKWARTPRYWFDSRLHYFTKNHGAGYAALATLARLAGGLVWETRRLVQRKPAADPPGFLRDLAGHALAAPFRRPGPAAARSPSLSDRTAP